MSKEIRFSPPPFGTMETLKAQPLIVCHEPNRIHLPLFHDAESYLSYLMVSLTYLLSHMLNMPRDLERQSQLILILPVEKFGLNLSHLLILQSRLNPLLTEEIYHTRRSLIEQVEKFQKEIEHLKLNQE